MENKLWGNSKPIWFSKERGEQNQYVEFLQEFDVTAKAVQLTISCDSRAAVYVNQKLVGFVLYDGTDHTSWYEEFELGDFVQEGRNQLRVLVFHQGVSSNSYTVGQPYLLFQIQSCDKEKGVLAQSGTETQCRKNRNYQNGPVEKNQTGFVWHYDETIAKEVWSSAEIVSLEGKEFRKRPILRQVLRERQQKRLVEHGIFDADCKEEFSKIPLEKISLEKEVPAGEAYYEIIDCGEECSGFMDLEVETEVPVKIWIGWGEHLADSRVRSHIGSRYFETSYRCGAGHHVFTNYFQRIGLRFLEVHVYPEKMGQTRVSYAGIRPLEYPTVQRGKIKIEDELHQKICDISVRTLQLCMHEHYEDTPWREQALYAMDSLNQALCGYYCFGEYDFARASLELLAEGLKEDGYLELHTPGKDAVMIPYFTFMWVLGMRDYLKFSKDTGFLTKYWDKIKFIVDKRLEEVQDGLLMTQTKLGSWNFYEWNDLLDGKPIYRDNPLEERVDAPYIMSFLLMLEAVEFISTKIGKKEYAESLKNVKEQMREACHLLFWDEEAAAYLTYAYREDDGAFKVQKGEYAQLVQSWAVLSGVAKGEVRSCLLKKMAAKENTWVPCTLSMIRFRYEALLQQPEKYAQLVFDDIADIWGRMVKQGATSFWETEDGEAAFEQAGSLCHGWSAMPVYFYYAYLLGIRPSEETEEFTVQPAEIPLKAKGQITTFTGKVIYGK